MEVRDDGGDGHTRLDHGDEAVSDDGGGEAATFSGIEKRAERGDARTDAREVCGRGPDGHGVSRVSDHDA